MFVLIVHSVYSSPSKADYGIEIYPTSEEILIDGKLDESEWMQIQPATDFWVQSPIDGVRAKKQTEVRIAHDNQFIYVGAHII